MSDDPQYYPNADQTDEPNPENAPAGQPEPAQPSEPILPGEDAAADTEAYAAGLRQSLLREGAQVEEKRPAGLFQRLARALRRSNHPQTAPDSAPPPAAELPPVAPEAAASEADFAAGLVADDIETAVPAETVEESALEDWSLPEGWQESLPEAEAPDFETTNAASDRQPETGATDWMADLRQTTSQPDEAAGAASAPDAEVQRGPDALRDFIAGLLHGQETKANPDDQIPDDLLAGRLERSLGSAAQPASDTAASGEEASEEQVVFDEVDAPLFETTSPYAVEPLPADLDLSEIFPGDVPADEETSLLENQEARFSSASEDDLVDDVFQNLPPAVEETPVEPAAETPAAFEPAEDTVQPTAEEAASALDVGMPAADEPVDLSQRDWEDGGLTAPKKTPVEDAYAAAFLTGRDQVSAEEEVPSTDYLLQQALDRARASEPSISNEDLRAIALEGYQEEAVAPSAGAFPAASYAEVPADFAADTAAAPVTTGPGTAAAAEPVFVPAKRAAPRSFSEWKGWFAARSTIEKILLVEALVVALVLIVALPFFIGAITRGARPQAVTYPTPRPLPGTVPYPVGVTLPGGWYFPLAKSTFVGGKWQPATSEWLEGTEVRRVVALPWNAQTEAVVRSFHPGDTIKVLLSNQETAAYKVDQVQRVPVSDTSILTDSSPSLLIILYQEQASERWIILSKP